MSVRFNWVLSLFIMAMMAMPVMAGEVYTPQRGDPLRKQVLDSIRPRIEVEVRAKVQFVVETMNLQEDWAFVVVTPQHVNGAPIDIAQTRFADDAGFMDGLTDYSLLKFQNNRWNEIAHVTGPTDVAYIVWPKDFGCPNAVLGLK